MRSNLHSRASALLRQMQSQKFYTRSDELPPPIKGLEGPFRFPNGRILYYDPKEGKYYDHTTDMYLDVNEMPAIKKFAKDEKEAALSTQKRAIITKRAAELTDAGYELVRAFDVYSAEDQSALNSSAWKRIANEAENVYSAAMRSNLYCRASTMKLRNVPANPGSANFSDNARQIAQTILEQLGGGKFLAMTGAKVLSYGSTPPSLNLQIGKGAQNGVKYCTVEYNEGKDDYTMQFQNAKYAVVKRVAGLYAEDLARVFTDVTGMYTRLFSKASAVPKSLRKNPSNFYTGEPKPYHPARQPDEEAAYVLNPQMVSQIINKLRPGSDRYEYIKDDPAVLDVARKLRLDPKAVARLVIQEMDDQNNQYKAHKVNKQNFAAVAYVMVPRDSIGGAFDTMSEADYQTLAQIPREATQGGLQYAPRSQQELDALKRIWGNKIIRISKEYSTATRWKRSNFAASVIAYVLVTNEQYNAAVPMSIADRDIITKIPKDSSAGGRRYKVSTAKQLQDLMRVYGSGIKVTHVLDGGKAGEVNPPGPLSGGNYSKGANSMNFSMILNTRVIEDFTWHNTRTGATASSGGAVPWLTPEQKKEWEQIPCWVWFDPRSSTTYGKKYKTRQEAERALKDAQKQYEEENAKYLPKRMRKVASRAAALLRQMRSQKFKR